MDNLHTHCCVYSQQSTFTFKYTLRSSPFWFCVQMILNTVLVVLTDLAAHTLGSTLFRQHFHLLLSAVVMFGPGLSLWVSQHSVFAKKTHFLYR